MSPVDPEIFDTFDTFNISPVLRVFFRMLKFPRCFGDIFSGKCRPNRSKTLTFEKKRLKQGKR